MSADRPSRILIVEGDASVVAVERRRLESAGYEVATAVSFAEALDRLKEASADLILLDVRLQGGEDGLELYARLRSAGDTTPVILVTGFSSEATAIAALRAGVRDFIPKSQEFLEYLPSSVEQVLRQVRTERRLAESEARLAAIVQSARDAIVLADPDGQVTLFNPAAEAVFRCSAADALGTPAARFIPGGDGPPTEGVRADGTHFPLEASAARVDFGGRAFTLTLARDVTDRVRAEEELHLRDRALEAMPVGVVIADHSRADDPLVSANSTFLRMTGYDREEVLGRNSRFLQGPESDPVAVMALRDAIRDEREARVEILNYRKDGTPFWNAVSVAPVRTAAGRVTHFVGVQTDLTDLKRLEEQYRQSQKMEAVGQLAGGVAHDFNNLLTVMLGYSEVLLDRPDVSGEDQAMVREIRRAGERAAALTRQLLAFSRKQILAPQVVDLNALVTDMDRMVRRLIGADIDLALRLAPDLGRVRVDPGQMEQVLLNLILNARDAMPTGGKLTVETSNVDLDAPYAEQHADAKPGPYVLLAVTDTGLGMDEATRQHAFEPFFTTKPVGRGSGLGLATVFGIVRQSDGRVEAFSEPGRGTSMKVYLPRLTRASVAEVRTPSTTGLPRGTETVLLAEDEDAVRNLAALVLRAAGYTVLEAADGEAAWQACQAHAGRIDIVVTDVVMPRMGGRELAERVQARHPGARVLFNSGYTDDSAVRHGLEVESAAFLQKPFTPSRLARKVREVLDRQ